MLVIGEIPHVQSIIDEASTPINVQDTVQGHAPEIQHIHFLTRGAQDHVTGIRQPDKWNCMMKPIHLESRHTSLASRSDLGTMQSETRMVNPYTR